MTYEQFCYWLSGLLETMKDDTKWDKLIRQKLNDTLAKESEGIEISSRGEPGVAWSTFDGQKWESGGGDFAHQMTYGQGGTSWVNDWPSTGWTWKPDEIQVESNRHHNCTHDLSFLMRYDRGWFMDDDRTYTLTKSYWPNWIHSMNPIDLQPINQSLPSYKPNSDNIAVNRFWIDVWYDMPFHICPSSKFIAPDFCYSLDSLDTVDTTLTTTGISL